jgi:hypothetical protein
MFSTERMLVILNKPRYLARFRESLLEERPRSISTLTSYLNATKALKALQAPYSEPIFRGDLVRRLRNEYGHLGRPGLNGVLRPRAWWPQMRKDVEVCAHSCQSCQVSQSSQETLERENPQHMVNSKRLSFPSALGREHLARAVRGRLLPSYGRRGRLTRLTVRVF